MLLNEHRQSREEGGWVQGLGEWRVTGSPPPTALPGLIEHSREPCRAIHPWIKTRGFSWPQTSATGDPQGHPFPRWDRKAHFIMESQQGERGILPSDSC